MSDNDDNEDVANAEEGVETHPLTEAQADAYRRMNECRSVLTTIHNRLKQANLDMQMSKQTLWGLVHQDHSLFNRQADIKVTGEGNDEVLTLELRKVKLPTGHPIFGLSCGDPDCPNCGGNPFEDGEIDPDDHA